MDIDISNDVVVPNVVGKTEAEAKSALKTLKVTVKYKSDSSKENGIVLSQSLSSGEVVSKDTKITITVNKVEKKNENDNTNKNNPDGDNNTTKPDDNVKPDPNPDPDNGDGDEEEIQ